MLDDKGEQVYKIAKGQDSTVAMIDEQAQTLLDNGFKGSLDQAIGNVIEK